MKDYTQNNVTLGDVDNLLNFASDNDIAVDSWEGVLNDTHLIYADKCIKIGNIKPRKYILSYHRFANPWSNTLYILHTDSFDKVREMIGTDDCIKCGEYCNLMDMSCSDDNDGYICQDCDVIIA